MDDNISRESDSQSTTLSLPSLSRSEEQRNPVSHSTTIGETEKRLHALQTENFNLKLRIYCLERHNNPNDDNNAEHERQVLRRETALKASARALQHKETQIRDLEKRLEALSAENAREKSLSVELSAHLMQFCRLLSRDNNRDDKWKRLLNSSEVLLNCAEVLTRDHNNQLMESSEEEVFSEPDRRESRARIGLQLDESRECESLFTPLRHEMRRRKRNQSIGVSTLDSSFGLIDLNSDSKSAQSSQTEISCFTYSDKSVQTSDDDTIGRHETTTDDNRDVFRRRNLKQKSIYAFFASLSPINTKRQRNVASIESPDQGIGDSSEESAVLLTRDDFQRLETLILEIEKQLNSNCISSARELTTNALNVMNRALFGETVIKRLQRMKKSKEWMERAISRQLMRTQEMISKTEKNLEF